MRVCDDNLRMNREHHGDDYPEADEIGFDVLHQSCVELFTPLSTKEDAMEAVERWVDHERWCVRALAQGAKHLLEHGSFNYGPTPERSTMRTPTSTTMTSMSSVHLPALM
jgi:hypothetical protein